MNPEIENLLNSYKNVNQTVAKQQYNSYLQKYLIGHDDENFYDQFYNLFVLPFEATYIGDGTCNTFELDQSDCRNRTDQYKSKICNGNINVNSNESPNPTFEQDLDSLLDKFNIYHKYLILDNLLRINNFWSKAHYKIIADKFLNYAKSNDHSTEFFIFDSMFGTASYPTLHAVLHQVYNIETYRNYQYLKENIPEQYKKLLCGGDSSCRQTLEEKEKEQNISTYE